MYGDPPRTPHREQLVRLRMASKSGEKHSGYHGAFRQSMAWLHTWAGVVFSLILYFVFITGSFGYFNSEITHWMQPEQPGQAQVLDDAQRVDKGFSYLQHAAPDATRYLVSIPSQRDSGAIRVFASLKEPTEDGDRFLREYLDPNTAEPLALRDTGGGNALYRMHYALHYMPYEAAIYIVGVATLFMFLAIITGIVTHKKIFTDFFTLRFGKGQRSWLDAHNVSSVLALPFMIMITYSGLVFYTFQYSPGVAVLSMGADNSAREALFGHIYPRGEQPKPTGESAQMLASVAGPVSIAKAHWPQGRLRYVELNHPGDSAAFLSIGRQPEGIDRSGGEMHFNAQSGALMHASAKLPADAVFSTGTLALHEGHFADYALRWVYFLSGLLGAAMIATGTLLWAKKRRTLLKGAPPPRSISFVERANLGTIVGLPLGCLAYFWANRLLPLEMADRAAWEMHCLFLVWAGSFMHAGARNLQRAWREQVAVLAGLSLALPVLNALTTDVHLVASIAQQDWVRAGFDISVFVFGALMCAVWPRLTQPQPIATPVLAGDSLPSAGLGG